MNFDKEVLELREKMYHRNDCIKKMCIKHFRKKCNCIKNNKNCNCVGIIDFDKFDYEKYIDDIIDKGQFDAMFNICLSVTNSLKCSAGKNFEKCIEKIFIDNGIKYEDQIFIDNKGFFRKNKRNRKGHTIDFVIPKPKYNTNIKTFKGDIITVKTTLRERYMQDKFLSIYNKSRLVLISLEKIDYEPNILSIKIDKNKKEFTKYILDIQKRY